MTEEKKDEKFDVSDLPGVDDLTDFPHPASEAEDENLDEDYFDDFHREAQEEAGLKPRPYKTLPFWLSILATVVAYMLASGVITEGSGTYEVYITLSTLLAYFGYDRVVRVFQRRQDQLHDTIPNFRKPAFYVSFLSTMAGFALGSGVVTDSTVAQAAGLITLIFGHLGIKILPWIRNSRMVDPQENSRLFMLRLVQYMYQIFYTEHHRDERNHQTTEEEDVSTNSETTEEAA